MVGRILISMVGLWIICSMVGPKTAETITSKLPVIKLAHNPPAYAGNSVLIRKTVTDSAVFTRSTVIESSSLTRSTDTESAKFTRSTITESSGCTRGTVTESSVLSESSVTKEAMTLKILSLLVRLSSVLLSPTEGLTHKCLSPEVLS